jgi:hypothetical protein
MRNRLVLVTSLLVLSAAPRPAAADFGVNASAGIGALFRDKDVDRTDVNLEILAFYKITIVKIDLAARVDLEHPDRMVQLLPGLRVALPFVYLRFAVPLNVQGHFSYGFLGGLGTQFSIIKLLAVFAELDTIYYPEEQKTLGWPLEARVGIELTF